MHSWPELSDAVTFDLNVSPIVEFLWSLFVDE